MFCTVCGVKLGLSRRIFRKKQCASCQRKAAEDQVTARSRYIELANALVDGLIGATSSIPLMAEAAQAAELNAFDRASINDVAFRRYATRLLADGMLTEAEEKDWQNITDALGVNDDAMRTKYRDVQLQLAIAQVNDGRLPSIGESKLIAKKGEVIHAEMLATLMKQRTVREFQGGYSGFSFRVIKGVRYHVGNTKGRSVVVGTEWVEEDDGTLSVSSLRAVFIGGVTTIEMPYSKVVNLTVFTDGIQFHLSNRKTAPLFKLESGDVIAAMTNAAMQKVI